MTLVRAASRRAVDDIEVERLADGAGLLGAVEDRDGLRTVLGQRGQEVLRGEGPVEPTVMTPDLLALRGSQVVGLAAVSALRSP